MTQPTEDHTMIRALFANAIDAPPAPTTATSTDDNRTDVDREFAAKLFGRNE